MVDQTIPGIRSGEQAEALFWAQLGFARQIAIDILGVTPDRFDLSPNAMLVDDLGADSLDFVEIQCLLSDKGIDARDEAFTWHMTLGDLACLIVPTSSAAAEGL